jgi:hypothetical protein
MLLNVIASLVAAVMIFACFVEEDATPHIEINEYAIEVVLCL